MTTWDLKTPLEVRDYEIDMQGIVHHSVYVNYLEYARSKLAKTKGIDVHQLHAQGFDIVVANLNIDYKSPLQPTTCFYVNTTMRQVGRLRLVFDQEIRRQPDDSLVLTATITCAILNLKTMRPCMPEILLTKLQTPPNPSATD